MSADLHVEISGEGDFVMETDSAWQVTITLNGESLTVTTAGYGDRARLELDHWTPERGPGFPHVGAAK